MLVRECSNDHVLNNLFVAGVIYICHSPQVLVRHRAGERLSAALQAELGTLAIALVSEPPTQYIDEYAADRDLRLALTRSMLRSSGLREQLTKASFAEDVVVLGALPHARPLALTVTRVPASFVPFNGSMVLRAEGLRPLPAASHRTFFFCCRARFPLPPPSSHMLFPFTILTSRTPGLEM